MVRLKKLVADLLSKGLVFAFSALLLSSCGEEKKATGTELIFNPHSASDMGDQKVPKLVFEEAEHDFGVISQGEKVKMVFAFTNEGDAPLLIFDVTSECGCTIPKTWPKETVLPGEDGEIEVTFDSEGKQGEQIREIRVATNGNPGVVRAVIKAEVIVPNQLNNLLKQK